MSIYRRSSACGPPIFLLYMFNVCICHKCFLMSFAFSFSVVFFFWRTDVCNFDEVWPILLTLLLVSFVSATSFYILQPHNHRDTALCFLLEDSQYNSLLPVLASHTAQYTFVDLSITTYLPTSAFEQLWCYLKKPLHCLYNSPHCVSLLK